MQLFLAFTISYLCLQSMLYGHGLSHLINIVFHSKLIIIEDEEAASEDTEEDEGEDLEFRLWL